MAQASQMLAWVSWGLENARKRPFCPSSLLSFVFRIETPSGSSLCTVTGVQCRKLTSKNQKINEHWSPDEIRVWQLPLFTYLFIENEKVSKDKYTNFILAILPSDRPLAEMQAVKPMKRKNVRGIKYIKQKTLKLWKLEETLKSQQKTLIVFETKDYDSLWKCKEQKTLIVPARQHSTIPFTTPVQEMNSLTPRHTLFRYSCHS